MDLLDLRPGETVADIGAGVGFHVPEILRRIQPGGTLIAVDPDERNLELLRRRAAAAPASNRLTVVAGAASQLGAISTASVDAVLMSLVLCCLVDKSGALDEAWRILRPGGRILVTFPRFGGFRPAAKRVLRVTEDRWNLVRSRKPWEERLQLPGWMIRRHRLQKPSMV